mmetsp:Transcript_14852/g.22616  ORF Transcript_14852/g.22616 Transcript_14852/m.22616 type:complete len:265 (-) Transcript_14852:220-1014(-)
MSPINNWKVTNVSLAARSHSHTNEDWILASRNLTSETNDLWLLSDPLQNRGVLVLSTEKRDKCIASAFPNGCTMKKVQNLEELEDGLADFLPASSESMEQKNLVDFDEVKRFELFRSVVDHEDDLLNQRVSWIILAQSFLMAAFISTSSARRSFQFATAMVGLATVGVTMPAIIAAARNIEVQQEVYFRGIESDERCQLLHGHGRDLSLHEQKEKESRRTNGHIFPNMAFRSKRSVKILYTVVSLAVVQVAGWCFLLFALIIDL